MMEQMMASTQQQGQQQGGEPASVDGDLEKAHTPAADHVDGQEGDQKPAAARDGPKQHRHGCFHAGTYAAPPPPPPPRVVLGFV